MRKLQLLIALLLAMHSYSFAQTQPCGNDILMDSDSNSAMYYNMIKQNVIWWRANIPDTGYMPNGSGGSQGGSGKMEYLPGCQRAKIILPVVVHILHYGTDNTPGTGSNISDAQVYNMLEETNKHLANSFNAGAPAINTGIQLCLATKKPDGSSFTGITRTASSLTVHNFPAQAAQVMQTDLFDPDKYLNIWIVDSIKDNSTLPGQMVAGYGPFPFMQNMYGSGIVLVNRSAGNYNNCTSCRLFTYSRGVVLTHELGHYFGALHTFQDGCTGLTSTTCATEGDLCCDVPPESGPSHNCSASNTCSESPDSSDQKRNFMNYSDESCQTTFTKNQLDIMYSTLFMLKSSLWNPTNINNRGLGCCYLSAAFGAGETDKCNSGSFTFTAIDYDSAKYRWKIFKGATLLKDTISDTCTYAYFFADTGKYTIQLTVKVQGDSITFSRLNYITIRQCSALQPSTQANWCFGNSAVLKFTGGGTIPDLGIVNSLSTPRINTLTTSITQSNANGNLLFYAGLATTNENDIYLYDKTYTRVSNGPINGSINNYGLLAVPMPSNGTRYYIFSSGNDSGGMSSGLRYSVFDTTLNSNKGDIVSTLKNKPLKVPGATQFAVDSAVFSGAITAIPKCNNNDYWVLVGLIDSNHVSNHKVAVFSVTASGISYHNTTSFEIWVGKHSAKVSPDGRWVFMGSDLMEFDRNTGILTHKAVFGGIYGSVSFSPNSNFLYYMINNGGNPILVQTDLYSENIFNSETRIAFVPVRYGMQLGLDDKIYIGSAGDKMSVINSPNERCTNSNPNACNYTYETVPLTINGIGGRCIAQLVNMIDAKKIAEIPLSIYRRQKSCDTVEFSVAKPCITTIKWYFGDGDSSTLTKPVHRYSSRGQYVVRVVVDGVQATDTFYIGIKPITIAGDTTICDTSRQYSYSAPLNTNYTYSWKATGGDHSSWGDFINFDLKWLSSGQIKLIVNEPKSGCKDSFSKTITVAPPLASNHIDSSQALCNADTPQVFTGTTPTGGLGTYTYQWLSSIDNISWTPISGATASSYQAIPPFPQNTLYIRTVNSGSCVLASNTITLYPDVNNNNIYVDSLPCVESSPFTIRGNTFPNHGYIWYSSRDAVNWNVLTGQTADSLVTTLHHDSIYFKRLVYDYGCPQGSYSNILQVKPKIYIQRQPQNYIACQGVSIYFDIEVENPFGFPISYVWKGINNSTVLSTASYLTNGTTPVIGDTLRFVCLIVTPCDTIFSDTAYAISERSPAFITHPLTLTANEEGTALFIAKGNSVADESYQWHYSWNNGSNWDSIPGEHNDTLRLNDVSMCSNGYKYKAYLFNKCSFTTGPAVSNVATLNVNKTRFADLWWRDNLWDGGVEPTIDSNGIWYSPDLWIRRNADGDTNHQNPNYDTASPNYIYYRIKNRGTDTSKGGELFIYWSKTAMGERWPIDWTTNSSNVYVNPCLGTIYYNTTYARGGEVNSAPINIPPIPPGGEWKGNVAWFPPNPYWYGTRVAGPFGFPINAIPDSVDVCLLGRILHCERDSFGLTRKEVQRIKPNIYHNNNIVTRNVVLFNINRIQRKATSWVGIRNVDGQTPCSDIKLPSNAPFSAVGSVTIHLDRVLLDAWEASGLLGSGYTMLDSSTLKVVPYQNFVMNNVCLDSNAYAQIGVEFELDSPATFTSAGTFQFTIGQYVPSTNNIVGAVNFDVNVTLDGYDSTEEHVDSLEFIISPNPTTPGLVFVNINSNFSTTGATINVYDGLGNPVISPHYISTLSPGGQVETVNLSSVSSGTYTMVVTANGINYSGGLVVF